MKKNKLAALFIVTIMIFVISGCTPQGSGSSNTASDAVHQIEDDGAVLNDDDPIAEEPQLDIDKLDESSEDSNVQGEIISAEPYKGNAD